jgi:hypothetical protein
MKKLLLTAALSIFAFGSAQITTDAGTFNKPSAGSTIFELSFTANFAGSGLTVDGESTPSMISMPEIPGGATFMMRKFDSDTKAKRYFARFDYTDSGEDGVDADFAIAAGMGIENHLTGAERLSTYWGYHGIIGYSTTSEESTEFDEFGMESTNSVGVDTFSITGGVFVGADYYFIPNVYFGVELGYGLSINSVDAEGSDNVTSIGLGGSVTGNFRMGFIL